MRKPVLLVLLFLMLLCSPSPSYPDGIYVTKDLKHALGAHTTLSLSKKQARDVEQNRTVTLSDNQVMRLRDIYDKIPRRLTVLSSRWDSCTCGFGLYAIWCRPGEIDIPHSRIEAQKESEDYLKSHPGDRASEEENSDDSDTRYISEKVVLDAKAEMFIAGKFVTEKRMYKLIERLATKQVKASHVYRSLSLDIPPPINDKVDQKIKELVDRLEQFCKKKGVDFWAMGLSRDKLTNNEDDD